MKTRCVNLYKQQQFYNLHTAKIRKTQTRPKQYIRQQSIIKQDEFKYTEYDTAYKEMVKEMADRLNQAEKQRKQLDIIFIEHYIGRRLTKEEKQKLMLYI